MATTRIVQYNNTSRKGTYIVIQEGKKRNTYKYDLKTPIDYYIEKSKNKTTKKYDIKKIQEKIQQNKKNNSLNKQFKRGATQVVVDLNRLGRKNETQQIYKKLLSPLVINKNLLNQIIANKNKLKTNFAYTIRIYSETENNDNDLIATIKDIGKKTPEEIYQKYKIEANLVKGRQLNNGEIEEITIKNKLPKGAGKQHKYGLAIERVVVTIDFQK